MAWRNLIKNKSSASINIIGLTSGMAVALLIGLWIYDELSFNYTFKNHDRIAQVMRHTLSDGEVYTGGQSNPMPLADELRSSFNDFEFIVMSTHPVNMIVTNGDEKFTQSGRFMESDACEVFSLKMLHGNRSGLTELNSILLSSSLARKLFNDVDPVNKSLILDTHVEVTVTAVYEDFPNNSEFHGITFIAPFELFVSMNSWAQKAKDNWRDNSFPIYTQLRPNTTFNLVSSRIKDVMLPHIEEAGEGPKVFLHPMNQWHLQSQFKNGKQTMSDSMKNVWLYGIIGSFVLLLACINFMNLNTARAIERTKEIGILKSVGSTRLQLAGQFLGESLLMVTISFALCLIVVRFSLPWFNEIAGKQIRLVWLNPGFVVACLLFILFTSLAAGSYPAFCLSSLQTARIVKGGPEKGRTVSRKVLVILQFTISATLVIGTVVVYQQIQFAKDRPVGYDRYSLISIPIHSTLRGKTDILRAELIKTGVVDEVSESSSRLTSIRSNNSGFDWQGKDPELKEDFGTLSVGYEFGKVIKWKILSGRDFSREFPTDSSGLIINEAAAKMIGFENPVGNFIKSDFLHKGKSFKIIGVSNDMVMESPFEPAKPTIFFLGSSSWIFVRIKGLTSLTAALPKIEGVFKAMTPETPFEFKFVDEEYASKFSAENRIGKLAGVFAFLAILISCLGMFGLVSFVAQQRTKEISIRKVFGASVANLLSILSGDFVILVIISCIISAPFSYYILDSWLQHYEYHVKISGWLYLATFSVVIAIALFTVCVRTIKVAIMNPVRVL